MARYLYSELAALVTARRNCMEDTGGSKTKAEWVYKHTDRLEEWVREYLPSGSGFDNGTKIDLDRSHSDRLVFTTSFHHMDEGGGYDGWTEHVVTVTPSLLHDYHVRVSGRNRKDIKSYIISEFSQAMSTDIRTAIQWERMAEDKGATLKGIWDKDGVRQTWFVMLHDADPDKRDILFLNGQTSWMDARDYAVRIWEEEAARG